MATVTGITAARIFELLGLKADASALTGKVDVSTYTTDMSTVNSTLSAKVSTSTYSADMAVVNSSLTGKATVGTVVTVTGGGKETTASATASTTATTVDLTNGNVQTVTLGSNTTFTLTGATNSVACSLSLYLKQDGTGSRLVTWPSSVKWPGAAAPQLSTGANKLDLVVLETLDGGTTWYGSLAGADYR